MKKLFAVVLILALALCGCAQKPTDKNSSVPSSGESSEALNSAASVSDNNSSDKGVSLCFLSDKKHSKWNTENAVNIMRCSSFCYDDESDTLFYNKTEIKNEKYSYSIVAKKGNEEKVLSKESAGCLYVFENKIYFSNDSQILCMNTDGTDRKVILESSGKNILPYWDGVLYINYDDWKIHRIAPDGSESVLNTQTKVVEFMLYEGKIFYGGFRNELSNLFELRCIDPETENDVLLFEKVQGFDVKNDKFYIYDENNRFGIYNFDLTLAEKILDGNVYNFYPYDDYLLYLCNNTDEEVKLVKYVYSTKQNTELYTCNYYEFLCGPYICTSNYEGDFIERWQE